MIRHDNSFRKWRGWWRLAIVSTTVIAIAAGCSRLRHPGADARIPLIVENRGYLDVNIFNIRSDGTRGSRLGTVSGFSTGRFSVRRNDLQYGQRMVLRVHAIGGNSDWISPGISISEGSTARLDVFTDAGGNLSRSQLYSEN